MKLLCYKPRTGSGILFDHELVPMDVADPLVSVEPVFQFNEVLLKVHFLDSHNESTDPEERQHKSTWWLLAKGPLLFNYHENHTTH